MRAIFLFDLTSYTRSFFAYVAMIFLLGTGFFSGSRFNLSPGTGIYFNSPYTTGFMLGMLSLAVIFIATVLANQLLFKEWDTGFDRILFVTPISLKGFVSGRFLSFFVLTFTGFLLMVAGFMAGQCLRTGPEMQSRFNITYYLYPLLVFGVVNSLFICSVLYLLAWLSRKKLLVAMGSLMLYILYMVLLVFSNSPFMAGSLPQSVTLQRASALADPFGLSAYFLSSNGFTVLQRNTMIVPLSGYFLLNRVIVTGLSILFIMLGYRSAAFSAGVVKGGKTDKPEDLFYHYSHPLRCVAPAFNFIAGCRSVFSFARMDLVYIFKNIALPAASILLLFFVGMEMYAEIEKGIRLPQNYASSGLMATTISENFHLPGLLLTVYFVNDIFWRSHTARFSMIESTAFYSTSKQAGHWWGISILLLYFTLLLIVLGLLFQCFYHYFRVDINAYLGVFVFNTFPLMLFAGFLLLINTGVGNRYIALGISVCAALFTASPLSKMFITQPLLRFFSGYTGVYSDFNGYGIYLSSFVWRLVSGTCIIAVLWLIHYAIKNKRPTPAILVCMLLPAVAGFISGKIFLQGYIAPKNKKALLNDAAQYEISYRKYQHLPQPTVTDVSTRIDLYPRQHAYSVEGSYLIKNLTGEMISSILVNFNRDFRIIKAGYVSAKEATGIIDPVSVLVLKYPLQPGDSARIHFEMSYHGWAVNGLQSMNAIIENGSFMRISRYYPQLGYQPDNEITDSSQRKRYRLGEATKIKKLSDPRSSTNDFIHLNMLISTDHDQTAIGTGELAEQWKGKNRNYFRYETPVPIPFRFALSSAAYNLKSTVYKGISIHVFYNPLHAENVDHLVNNAKLSMDYCRDNFGPYPFRSVTFAEVSSFTRGFAATAYPAVIFMTENMVFHANIKADKQQDVINELAGHELSHLWWGSNQIAPDEREGAAMLTETLAMYTEMMMYKKMYGKEKMEERVKVHQQIYDSEKGFSEDQPLYMVTAENVHISYSKGAVVMVKLSELIGEAKVNEALRNFLRLHRYPNARPLSTDLVDEILKVSDPRYHKAIKKMFMEI
ncbi:M1 family aminopeptidase [Chitinophaga sp. OAE865]|uniref:ABC transporter permease/M1 family aminopeptidase n=1 Tax=Chitinophaga sp. OAE865 TaxID=2817898 RepID=UPI001AEA9E1A